ncbi:MAG TPA: permease [Treponemataceae bacterium]|nr:permease [Treponemataceae bacterium]
MNIVSFFSSIGSFIQHQILGMQFLNSGISSLLVLFGLQDGSVIHGMLTFFLYDVIKILILLSFLIFVISWIQSYFPPERTKRILGKYKGLGARILSALLGTVTPFCSCSSIPLFIGFTSASLPVGVTFSFLISSPLVDLGSLILLSSIFGFKAAAAYVIAGLILAVAGGTLIEKLGLEKYVETFITKIKPVDSVSLPELTKRDRYIYAREQVKGTVKKVFPYLLAGVALGALIHNVIPESWIQAVLGKDAWYSPILAALVGIPMYADIFGTIPIAEALFAKSVGIGTILSFMMGVTALSLPSMILLRKAVQPKLLAWFIGIVSVGIIVIGYVFNAFQALLV